MRLAKPRIDPYRMTSSRRTRPSCSRRDEERPRAEHLPHLIAAPKAAKGFFAWANYVLSRRNDLPPREREIVILRIGFLCKSGYEWTQHDPHRAERAA